MDKPISQIVERHLTLKPDTRGMGHPPSWVWCLFPKPERAFEYP